MYEIINDVPIPPVDRPQDRAKAAAHKRRKYPFEELEVGQGFFAPGKMSERVGTYASTMGKRLGRKFTVRRTVMKKVEGQWRPAEPDEAGAMAGVGVWRKE